MASVTFKSISKRFDATEVLHDVSLEIAEGEFLVLVGPSGCGKSTLLRMLAGLEETTEGEIFIGDKVVNHLQPRNREIAMVFQDYALYPHMTVEENMSFGLRLWRYPRHEIETRVREAAEILQIQALLGRRPAQLSGGQRQRVAIGRAIVRKPKAFLFDEPLSNLDAKLREEMRVEIAKLHQRLKATIIYVTHDQIEAMTLAGRIAVISGGRIQQVGAPEEVFSRPANVFVGGFIGSPTMNFMEGELRKNGDGCRFANEHVDVPVPSGPAGDVKLPRPAVLGVRPECVQPGAGAGEAAPAANALPEGGRHGAAAAVDAAVEAEIEVVELLGQRKNVYLKVGGNKLLATVDASFKGKPGENASVRFDPAGIHLFDKVSSRRL